MYNILVKKKIDEKNPPPEYKPTINALLVCIIQNVMLNTLL